MPSMVPLVASKICCLLARFSWAAMRLKRFFTFNSNVLKTNTIAFPCSLGVIQKGKPGSGFFFSLIPTLFNAANMACQEFRFVWVLKKYFALRDEVFDNVPFGLHLRKRLLLSLNQLFNILNAAGSNVTGRAEHDSIQELNIGFQLVTISITFPVEINFDLGLENSGNEVHVLGYDTIQFCCLVCPFRTSSLSH